MERHGVVLLSFLSKELNIDRKTAIKWARQNNCLLETKNRSSGAGSGQRSFAITVDDAERMRRFYGRDPKHDEIIETGVFFILHVAPDLDKNRIKLGFANDVNAKLDSLRVALPTLTLVKIWPCLRSWEAAAVASIGRDECVFLTRDIIQCVDYRKMLTRADAFFGIMPFARERSRN